MKVKKSVGSKEPNHQQYKGSGWAVEHSEGTDYAPDCIELEFSSDDDDLRPLDDGYADLLGELLEQGITHEGADIYRIYRVEGVFYREKHYGAWSRWGFGEDLLEAKEALEEDW
jgi:hypothetical protein